MTATDTAIDVCMIAIDKSLFLRDQIKQAAAMLASGEIGAARRVLEQALEDTDVGSAKVWQPGEEPF